MTRVVKGIYDDVELETGFFIEDKKVELICDWLESYAGALERAWKNKGYPGDPKTQKFAQIRSFKIAVDRMRAGGDEISGNVPKQENQKTAEINNSK